VEGSKTQCREKRKEGRRRESLVGSGDPGTCEQGFGGNMHGLVFLLPFFNRNFVVPATLFK
jgi:hypothetical protein